MNEDCLCWCHCVFHHFSFFSNRCHHWFLSGVLPGHVLQPKKSNLPFLLFSSAFSVSLGVILTEVGNPMFCFAGQKQKWRHTSWHGCLQHEMNPNQFVMILSKPNNIGMAGKQWLDERTWHNCKPSHCCNSLSHGQISMQWAEMKTKLDCFVSAKVASDDVLFVQQLHRNISVQNENLSSSFLPSPVLQRLCQHHTQNVWNDWFNTFSLGFEHVQVTFWRQQVPNFFRTYLQHLFETAEAWAKGVACQRSFKKKSITNVVKHGSASVTVISMSGSN